MVMRRDGNVATAPARATPRGLVLAGDRAPRRRAALSHSRAVRWLKIGLPLTTLFISGLYGISILKTVGWGRGIPTLAIPQIVPDNLAMDNPHYEGFNKDGGHYWVKADKAQQDLKSLGLIKLSVISGELTDAKKQKTTLTAKRGTFDNKASVLELYDAIEIGGDAGMQAHLTRATVETKENIITSNEPVTVTMAAGTINANQMTARQKVKEYTFVDNVRTHLNAREPSAQPEPKSSETGQLIGKSNAPVDIDSNRLDINDATKIAIFSGNVTAAQDGASMATPELEVSFEGGALPQASAGTPASGAKVKRMIAKNPVTLKQANGDVVTSQAADFDPIAQRATLEGDVVMAQQPDKRATADKAEIDESANTILLTGDVLVTQGQNALKGRRLLFNRASNKMQMTAPGASGAYGRINARFQKAQTGAAQPAKPPTQAEGIAFGASFKTDPSAPVVIDANRLDIDDAAKQAIFTGDVHAVQGEFVIHSADLTANYAGSAGLSGTGDAAKQTAAQITHIKARTNVEIISKDGQKATGDWADFDPKANIATLGGNVVLTQGKNVVRGTKLVIDMTTGETTIKTEAAVSTSAPAVAADGTATAATSNAARPSAVFYPGEMKARASKAGAAAAAATDQAWQPQSAPRP
jgi:LPS export ABC transporter protein LptC/lipopolysaccharide transport protein LptA